MNHYKSEPLKFHRLPKVESIENSRDFLNKVSTRRTVREFSSDPIPKEVLENAIQAAGTAPSGANIQPWHFVVVTDKETRHRIRIAAEEQEEQFYEHRASEEWLKALEPIGTNADKHFLDSAPCQIAVFLKKSFIDNNGEKKKSYYPNESVGLATGLLITALHFSGIATLTYTPSPMHFLTDILGRPDTERPYMIVVCGYPSENATVPAITKKPLSKIADFR
ncbi:MAG: nitroreductase family protein [Candidatus Marinimicrobia bacterium]|nr:nitroreductase family protein [Candidatus Neomarinimicrobiota bacterium]